MESKTGLIFDDRMTEHYCTFDTKNIECPERYSTSMEAIKRYDLLSRCRIFPSRDATVDELQLLHSKQYIDEIKNTMGSNDEEDLQKLAAKYDSVYYNSETYKSALLATGCTIELVSAILEGTVRNGMAIVRPPGHHALEREACGFCFFNNVAIAAKNAIEKHHLQRVLIVDWDVHHGQATQRAFYNDPRVLYFSIHRYENGLFWPHLRESNFDYVGGPAAQGFNINVPLNTTGLGNAEYLAIFNNILLPVAHEFNPELILISAGYDAAWGCPEGEMKVTPQAYGHFVSSLSNLSGGRICVVLEGGYFLPSLSEGVAYTLKALLGDACCTLAPCSKLNDSCVESILNVLSVQRPFWDSLKIQNVYDSSFDGSGSGKHVVKLQYAGNPLEGLTTFPITGYYPVRSLSVVSAYEEEIRALIAKSDTSLPQHRTGFVFDARDDYSECSVASHSESSSHAQSFFKRLLGSGLLQKCVNVQSQDSIMDEDFAPKVDLKLDISPEVRQSLMENFEKAKMCQNVYPSIVSACEKLLLLVDAVWNKTCLNGFALTRPIGHYPDSESASGLSILQSASVATQYLLSHHKAERVLILDVDTRQGNASQNIFYQDNRVLCVSLYYQDGEYLVTLPEVRESQVGSGQGKGYNVNIPFHHTIHDGDLLAALLHVILPISYEFLPQFTFVTLGYNDSVSQSCVSPSCLSVMTKLLQRLSDGKMILISEGDLASESGPDVAAHCLSVLLNEACVPLKTIRPTTEGCDSIRNVVKRQKQFWNSLVFDQELPATFEPLPEKRTSSLRRQSSDPVAIPKPQTESGMTAIHLEVEMEEDFWNDSFFCVTPLENCPHLELLQPLPSEGLNVKAPCQTCDDPKENWVCLHCYQVYCGRFVNQHMLLHGMDMKHYLTLSYSDLSVWCYACESYIHNNALSFIKEHAHDRKFGLS